jgi:FAD/FMN-containing dehydrogenase
LRCFVRGETGYEDVRRGLLWNARTPGRFPELIVQPRSVDEVVEAVGRARSRDLGVAVRSGGHSWCGAPLRDGSLLVDVGRLDAIEIDLGARRAVVGPAAETGALVERLSRFNLAFPAGHCPTVALGGYLLAGGFGWNYGIWGRRATASTAWSS